MSLSYISSPNPQVCLHELPMFDMANLMPPYILVESMAEYIYIYYICMYVYVCMYIYIYWDILGTLISLKINDLAWNRPNFCGWMVNFVSNPNWKLCLFSCSFMVSFIKSLLSSLLLLSLLLRNLFPRTLPDSIRLYRVRASHTIGNLDNLDGQLYIA